MKYQNLISMLNHAQNIARKKNSSKDVIFTSMLFTSIFSTFLSIILFYIACNIIEVFKLDNIREITDIKILLGLIITNFYLTLEGIYKGNLYYKSLSIFNLLFYSISLSLPCIFVLYKMDYEIFAISIIIKFFVVVFMFFLILYETRLHNLKISKYYLEDCIKNLKWISLNSFLNQIYNYFDKYIIKVFLDNVSFIYYSVSQQITSKFGDPLVAFNNIFIAKATSKKKYRKDNLNFSCIFYLIYITAIFLILYFFLEIILKIWLGNAYAETYFDLIKIFFLIATIGSFSNLLIDYYDLSSDSKYNTSVELAIFLPFILGIIFSISYKNLFFFVFVIFIKSLLGSLIRIYKIRHLIEYKIFILTQFLFIIFNTIMWFLNYNVIILIFFQILSLIIYLPFKKIKKFYNL